MNQQLCRSIKINPNYRYAIDMNKSKKEKKKNEIANDLDQL